MSQISGAITLETSRFARQVAVEVVRLLDETGAVPALAAAVARELSEPGEPGGYPIGREPGESGSEHYDRGES